MKNIPPNLTDITGLIFRKKTGFRLATVCLINLRWQQLPQLNLIQTQKPKLAQYNAKIHLSYKKIVADTSLRHFTEDCHHMAYTHTIKAESINEKYYRNNHISGLIYFIEGNTASSTQFYVTDSVHHFLRGALYFKQHPDKDSLAPVIHFLRQDIVNLMETIRFK